MDALTPDIRRIEATDARVAPLIAAHLDLMRASSPACSVHAMEASDLLEAGADFFAAFEGEDAVAMGAIKLVEPGHAELKSMHVLQAKRGAGLADAILRHCMDAAKARGATRLSLETGSRPAFAPAVAFYRRHGFEFCPPFVGYEEDPESVFLSRSI